MEQNDAGARPEPTSAARDLRGDPPWGSAQDVPADYRPGSVAFPRDGD